MQIVHPRCCGLDVHKKSVVACVLITAEDGTVQREIRTYATMTADLLRLAGWAGVVGDSSGGHGINRGVLAPALQYLGGRRLDHHPGQCPPHQGGRLSARRMSRTGAPRKRQHRFLP
jgi:hypothetical protein